MKPVGGRGARILLALVLALGLAANPQPAAASWSGSMTVYFGNGDGIGTVTSDDGGIDCHYEDLRNSGDCSQSYVFPDFQQSVLVAVTYTPEHGSYVCVNGSTGCVPGGAPKTVTYEFRPEYTNEVFITPSFNLRTYQISIDAIGPGSVSANGAMCTPEDPADLCREFKHGATANLSANANEGSDFDYWVGHCPGSSIPTCKFTVTYSASVNAIFNSNVVQVSRIGSGSVCAIDPAHGCGIVSMHLDDGTSLTLEARAASGWHFASWTTGPCIGRGATCTFVVSKDVVVTVRFDRNATPPPPTATPKPTPKPTLSPTPGPTPGTSVRPIPTPSPTRVEQGTSEPAPSQAGIPASPSSAMPTLGAAPSSIDPALPPAASRSAGPMTATRSGVAGTAGPTVPDGSAATSGPDVTLLLVLVVIVLVGLFVVAFLAGRRRAASGNASRIA